MADIDSGIKTPTNIKQIEAELKKVNKELELYDKKANDISNQQSNLSFEVKTQQELGDLANKDAIASANLEIERLDNEMLSLANKEEIAKQKAVELSNKLSELKNNNPEVQQLKQQVSNMTSSLDESKQKANELKDDINKAFNQKASFQGIQKGIDGVGEKLDRFKNRMTRLISTVAIFSLLRSSLTSLRNSVISLLKTDDSFNANLNQIKANLMTAFAPIYNACLPAINSLMSALSKITGTIATFVSSLFGISLNNATKQAKKLSSALADTAKKGDKTNNSLSSLDEIENISDNDNSSDEKSDVGGIAEIDYSGELEYSERLLNFLNTIKNFIVENKDLIIGAISGITIALIALKLLGLDPIKSLGIGIVVAGIILLIKDVIDFLKNPTWEKFGEILIDIGIILAGLLLIFGGWPLAIAAICAVIVGVVIKNWDKIKDGTVKVWNAIWSVIKGVINLIIGAIENMINTVISGLNKIIKPLADIGNTILSAIGIDSFSFSVIPKVSLPRLATGTVIPPRQEFAAILGDQKHGTNIEAPLDTIVDAFNIALNNRNDNASLVQLLIDLNRNVLEMAERPVNVEIDGDKVVKATYDKYEDEGRRRKNSTSIIRE